MLTRDDLLDIIIARLGSAEAGKIFSRLPEVRGRRFLTEHEVKRRLTGPSQQLTIPQDAILSPLAAEWLALRRIPIVRE